LTEKIQPPARHTNCQPAPEVDEDEVGREKGEAEVDELWNNVISEVKGDEVKELQIHWVIGKKHEGYLIHAAVLQIEFGDCKVMDEFIFGDRRNQ
jgi:hypothetical protein